MKFTSDEDVKKYVNSQLANVRNVPNGPFYAFIRPQWRYRHLPSNEMDVGHLEWKIYMKAELGRLGGDVPSPEMMDMDVLGGRFTYWVLRITSDYRFFIFVFGNSSAGGYEIYKAFDFGSTLCTSGVTEDGDTALSHYVEHVLTTYNANNYFLS